MTELETRLYEALLDVQRYMTQRTLGVKDFTELMAEVMGAIKAYENKKFGTKIR